MRVSNIGLTTAMTASLQHASSALEEAQQRVQSGQRVTRPSDDPQATTTIMASSSSLRALEQYERNVNAMVARLNVEESALDQLGTGLERAKQIGIQEGSGTATAQTRLVAKAEIDQILAFAIQLANTRHEGEFLFGGDQSLSPPIGQNVPPFLTASVTGQRRAEIGEGQYATVNHNAQQVFIDTGILASLDQLSTALANNDATGIATALGALDSAHGNLQAVLGDVGARAAQAETAQTNLGAVRTTLQAFRSNLQDLDLEEAVTELVARQSAYQAAMLATSRILGLSLADYMR